MKRQTTRIKEAMGKNTTMFIQGRRSRKQYLKIDDDLHKRLFKVMKKKGK